MERVTKLELINVIIDAIKDGRLNGQYACEVHHEIFNTDYYIIGTYKAEQWLIANGGVFNAIEVIQDYEKSNFGEVSTDLSQPERVCNMFTYILGEEVLNESEVLSDKWNERLTDEDINDLLKEFEAMI